MAFYRCGGGADTSIVTAIASDVLSPKVIVDADGNPLTGTMKDNGAVSPSALDCGSSYTIPKGYHNGNGKVTANSLSSQTIADATAGNILSGKTAWVNGSKVTGTMENRGAVTQTLNAGGSYTIPAGYHNGSGKVTANSLASQGAGNILTGEVITNSATKYFPNNFTVFNITNVPATPKYLAAQVKGLSFGLSDSSGEDGLVIINNSASSAAGKTQITHFFMIFEGVSCSLGVYSGGCPLGSGYYSEDRFMLEANYNTSDKIISVVMKHKTTATGYIKVRKNISWKYIVIY